MEPAHHHGHAAAAVLAGDLIGTLGGVGLDRDGHEIGRPVERDRFHAVVVERDLDVLRGERGEHGDRQRLHLPRAHIVDARLAPDRGMHQGQAHHAASRKPIGQSQV